jgi:integrase
MTRAVADGRYDASRAVSRHAGRRQGGLVGARPSWHCAAAVGALTRVGRAFAEHLPIGVGETAQVQETVLQCDVRHRGPRTLAQETRLFIACREARNRWLLPLLQLALETGMRRRELLRLRWEYIDLNRRTAHLPDTKNGEARTVPLSTTAVVVLLGLPRALYGDVFPGVTTETVRRSYMRVNERTEIEGLRFHDLRHEATTRLLEKGLNIVEVASVTVHKGLRMLRRYKHLRAEDLAQKLG